MILLSSIFFIKFFKYSFIAKLILFSSSFSYFSSFSFNIFFVISLQINNDSFISLLIYASISVLFNFSLFTLEAFLGADNLVISFIRTESPIWVIFFSLIFNFFIFKCCFGFFSFLLFSSSLVFLFLYSLVGFSSIFFCSVISPFSSIISYSSKMLLLSSFWAFSLLSSLSFGIKIEEPKTIFFVLFRGKFPPILLLILLFPASEALNFFFFVRISSSFKVSILKVKFLYINEFFTFIIFFASSTITDKVSLWLANLKIISFRILLKKFLKSIFLVNDLNT